jgi:hypothetical protein
MSTQPHPTTTDAPRTASRQFTTRDAPRTFSPSNTHPCPQMFADKWTATDER